MDNDVPSFDTVEGLRIRNSKSEGRVPIKVYLIINPAVNVLMKHKRVVLANYGTTKIRTSEVQEEIAVLNRHVVSA